MPVDRSNPLLRYQLITINADSGTWKAFIKDLLKGEARFLKIGETIGDCKLVEISADRSSVRLKPASGSVFSIKQGKSVR